MTDSKTILRDSLNTSATVRIDNVNAVLTPDGLRIEFEGVAQAPGFMPEFVAGETLLFWNHCEE